MSNKEPKAKTPWLAMCALAVGCSAASGGAVYMMDKRDHKPEVAAEAKPLVAEKPIFVKVAPFTVNLNSERSSRLLYTGITLEVGDQATADFLTEYATPLRSRLLVMMGNLKYEDVTKPEGKDAVKASIQALLAQPFATPQPELKVKEVLFSEFIIQ